MYTYKQMQTVYQMYDEGKKWKDIEAATGLRPGSIHNLLKKRNVPEPSEQEPVAEFSGMQKTSKKLCAICHYNDGCITDPSCSYRLKTGTPRNCPPGWCDKFKK